MVLRCRVIAAGVVRAQPYAAFPGLGSQDGLDSADLEAGETAAEEGLVHAAHQAGGLRGVQATGSTTMTSTLLGLLRSDARSRSAFLALTGASS